MENKIPIFERGMILDHKMLDGLRSLSTDYQELQQIDKKYGIISGMKMMINENLLTISPGLIKTRANFYLLKDHKTLTIPVEDGTYYCGIIHRGIKTVDKFRRNQFEFVVTSNKGELEFEFCQVNRRKAAKIRFPEYFSGQVTEYNLINLINGGKATTTGVTLNEQLIVLFAQEMLSKNDLSTPDYIMAYSILNGQFSALGLETYISQKGLKIETSNLESIYTALNKILQQGGSQKVTNENEKRKMLVE